MLLSRWARAQADTVAATAPPVAGLTTNSVPSGIPDWTLSADAQARGLWFVGSGPGSAEVYGATNRLAFQVKPILLAGMSARLGFPDRKGWEDLGLDGSYETDRAYSSGGTVQTTQLNQQLGVSSAYSDIFAAALNVVGVRGEIEFATFTNGRVQIQDVATGTPFADAPLVFTRVRADATLNLSRYFIDADSAVVRPEAERSSLFLRVTHYELRLPRIVYLTQRQSYTPPGASQPREIDVVVVETPAQNIDVSFTGVGATYRWAMARGEIGLVAADATLVPGLGQVSYYLPARLGEPAGPGNRLDRDDFLFGLVGRLGLTAQAALLRGDFSIHVVGSMLGEEYLANATIKGDPGGTIGFRDTFFSAFLHVRAQYGSTARRQAERHRADGRGRSRGAHTGAPRRSALPPARPHPPLVNPPLLTPAHQPLARFSPDAPELAPSILVLADERQLVARDEHGPQRGVHAVDDDPVVGVRPRCLHDNDDREAVGDRFGDLVEAEVTPVAHTDAARPQRLDHPGRRRTSLGVRLYAIPERRH